MARSAAARASAAAPEHAPPRRSGATQTRRRSGRVVEPARRAPSPAVARPRGRVAPTVARFVEARTSGLLDQLLRGRLWVGFIGALLAGIVFLNVSLLQLNQDIARTTVRATALDRQNSALRARLAVLDSAARIQRLAEARGMLMPAPGQYRYLRARPWLDAELANRRAAQSRQLALVPSSAAQSPTAPAAGTAATTTTAATATPVAAAPTATAGTP